MQGKNLRHITLNEVRFTWFLYEKHSLIYNKYFIRRVLTPKPQVQQLLDLRQTQTKARNSITWFFINSVLFSIIVFDM